MAEESEFLIKNPKEIVSRLNMIIQKRQLITAHFGDKQSFITKLIEVDEKHNVLEVDCSSVDELNAQLLLSPKVMFYSEIDGVKVFFSGKGIKQVKDKQDKKFVLPMPASIFWMQRRQNFRAYIPRAHTHCFIHAVLDIKHELEDGSELVIPEQVRFKIADISATGFAFLNTTPGYANYLLPPQALKNCLIQLHDEEASEARIDFELVSSTKIKKGGAIVAQRIGCRFTQMPLGFDNVIQHYVRTIELQNRIAENERNTD